ncbi:MAG: FAD-dependent oxidoreductase [Candidatus Dormibacteraeota bacterium]|uniref:FAD-dependent oxidoreductase n=1 Tax=Candidatus Aeolococcus gillhamiae TaxID=3127015 RepID=A0A2W5ZFV6_9BACT|nr:FAD-dependent oxidoreductase [Candidatus Dormibacteraeota bacterium]PZR82807.1 MAG: phytoene dehydrogenase [Candidatus Dormibacter sp. RRmetagenome_bin12]
MRVVVVGAGLAGLAATCRLIDRGHDVVLVERTRLVGGKATSFTVDGVEVDNGQHVHLGCCTDYLDFVRSLGMSDALWNQRRFEVTVLRREGRPSRLFATRGLPPALSLLPSFAAYAPLRLAAKLEVVRGLRSAGETPGPGETFAAWLRRHGQGRAAIDGFWELFVVPALNGRLDEVAAADALFVIRTAFTGHPDAARIGWSRVPLARIAEAAAARAGSVRLRSGVVALLDDGGDVHGVRCNDGEEIVGDAVVLAVPPARAAAILGDPTRYGVTGLDRFQSRAIVDVHLWFDAAVDIGFAAIVGSPVQWVFEKQPGYLCCSLSAADTVVGRPEADLVELCHGELTAVLPRLGSARLVRGAVTRDPEATFIPAPGLHRPGSTTSRPNLAIAGAWTATGWPATMESAVRSGRAAADVLANAPRRATRELETARG